MNFSSSLNPYFQSHQTTNTNQEIKLQFNKNTKRRNNNKNCETLKFILSLPKVAKLFNFKNLIFTQSILALPLALTMIEGFGKGVKYSLFIANAIIFVSIKSTTLSINSIYHNSGGLVWYCLVFKGEGERVWDV